MFKFFLYKVGLFLLDRLPSGWFYNLATFISDIQYLCSFRDRKAVKNNLKRICSPGTDIDPLTREVFRNFGKYLVEFFQMKEIADEAFIKSKVKIEGLERFDEVLAKGKGGILLTAHIGNWELGAVLVSVLGYPLMAIALPHKERPVNDLFNAQREAKGVTVVPTNVALRRCIEQLRKNKLIALVADRAFGNHGIMMDFLGCKALIPKGAAMFAVKTGAPIIPTFCIRNDDGSFNLNCCDPIYPPQEVPAQMKNKTVLDIMRRYVSVIEDKIRAHPSQWLLFRELCVQ